jgi:hypothetical protein
MRLNIRFPDLVSLVGALVAACGPSAPPSSAGSATDTPVLTAYADALGAIDCPWGTGQCAWPGAQDSVKAFHVPLHTVSPVTRLLDGKTY